MRSLSKYNTKTSGKQFMAVAEAMAMNAVPEYWLGFKSAGVYCATLFMIAKQFLHH